jgi:hypothetical protein
MWSRMTHDGKYRDEVSRPVERLVTEGITYPRPANDS